MKIVLYVVGALLILNGAIWTLQGINVLPGSPMTGQIKWAVYGSLSIVIGIAAVFTARKLRRRSALS